MARQHLEGKAYRKRSMPSHSRDIASQNPRKNDNDDAMFGIANRMFAMSAANACCTNGLSDIQKPGSCGQSTSKRPNSETHNKIYPSIASPSRIEEVHRVKGRIEILSSF